MIKMNRISFIVSFLLAALSVSGQTVTIETVLDTQKIEMGDRVELTYIVEQAEGNTITFPNILDTIILGVEVLEPPVYDSLELKDGRTRIKQKIVITSFEEGMYFIPPQAFGVENEYGADTLFSKESYMEVLGVKVDTTGTIRDIAGLEKAPIIFRDFLPLFILAGLALIVYLIVYLIRLNQKKKGLIKAPEKPLEPAHIIALRELDRLKALKLWQQNEVKEHYTELSNIIRAYIERQFDISAMEETTSEIIRDITSSKLNQKVKVNQLQNLLSEADLVKFAKSTPMPEENLKQLEAAYQFVKETKELFVKEDAIKDYQEKIEKLSNSYALASKIRNVKDLNDLEVLSRLEAGAKLVQYQYVISVIVATFTLNSPIYLFKSGEKAYTYSWPYTTISVLLGWWGIPWGPIRTIRAIVLNNSEGKQVKL